MRVEITGLPATSTVLRLDRIGQSSGLKDGPWKRVCDYLLVGESDGATHAVFIELKKTLTNEDRPRDQLRRSLPLLEYLRSVCAVDRADAAPGSPTATTATVYSIICERGGRRLRKQRLNANPERQVREAQYEGITIRTFVGTRVSLGTLTGT